MRFKKWLQAKLDALTCLRYCDSENGFQFHKTILDWIESEVNPASSPLNVMQLTRRVCGAVRGPAWLSLWGPACGVLLFGVLLGNRGLLHAIASRLQLLDDAFAADHVRRSHHHEAGFRGM